MASRRSFIKGIAAAAFAAPHVLRAADRILGSGEFKYEAVKDWGALPADKKFGSTHGIQCDAQGRVYVHSQSADSICVFDAAGKFIKAWGAAYAGGAHGLLLNREADGEFLYLATTLLGQVVKTTLDGEIVWRIGAPPHAAYPGGKFFVPTNVAIERNGDVFIADGYGKAYIHRYSAKAEYICSIGGPGVGAGKFICPHGIWIDSRGAAEELVVADCSARSLQRLSLDGKYSRTLSSELRMPAHLAQRGDTLLVADLHARLTLLDKDNKLITHLGDDWERVQKSTWPNTPAAARTPGRFIAPHAACFDPAGNIYVVDWVPQGRVTKLRKLN